MSSEIHYHCMQRSNFLSRKRGNGTGTGTGTRSMLTYNACCQAAQRRERCAMTERSKAVACRYINYAGPTTTTTTTTTTALGCTGVWSEHRQPRDPILRFESPRLLCPWDSRDPRGLYSAALARLRTTLPGLRYLLRENPGISSSITRGLIENW